MLKGMNHGGFSIIEIVITITILGILLALGVVGMNTAQMNARDAERQADVEAIGMHLEAYYRTETADKSVSSKAGTYPGTFYMSTAYYRTIFFPDANSDIFIAPGASSSIVIATNTIESASGVSPQPTIDQYVYQALTRTDTTCTDHYLVAAGCTRFNLYYRLEKDGSVQMVKSNNR